MDASGSSLRMFNLGTLFKIGSLAAIAYFLLKRIKEGQAVDLEERQSLSRHCRRSFSTEERASVKKINIDSSCLPVSSVKKPQTMQALDDVLSSPTPADESSAPEGLIPTTELDKEREKLAAIEAIERMAAEGNQEAKKLLFEHAQDEDFLVRREAIRGILQYGGKEDRELLQKTLPAGDWYIMDIRPEDMRKVC
jgi:hypothetical protein